MDIDKNGLREASREYDIVELTPYPYQVGGHSCFLTYDEETVCKPLVDQEHKFYIHFPKELKQFIPRCRGVVKVHFEKSEDNIKAFAIPLDSPYVKDTKRLKSYIMAKHRNKVRKKVIERKNPQNEECVSTLQINRRCEDAKFKNLEKFLLLEDLSHSFKRPCVIDLKMGTRCYGDSSSKSKCERKKKRALNSTSATLGVRLCGMTVYNSELREYTFTDKYKGRVFNDDEFICCVKNFFYNGKNYRVELLPLLKRKLEKLLEQVEKSHCCRFYCSSLLLLYDGSDNSSSNIVMKMVDFAHTRVKEEPNNHHIGPDRGYILGIKTLINITNTLINELCL